MDREGGGDPEVEGGKVPGEAESMGIKDQKSRKYKV